MPTVRTLYDNWSFYHPLNCHMYQGIRRGTVFDGDLGAFLLRTAADAVEEVGPPPVAREEAPPPAALSPASPTVEAPAVDDVGEPAGDLPAPEPVDGGFDPAEHTVAQVLAYVKDHPDEGTAIRALEASETGKRRTVILSGIRD